MRLRHGTFSILALIVAGVFGYYAYTSKEKIENFDTQLLEKQEIIDSLTNENYIISDSIYIINEELVQKNTEIKNLKSELEDSYKKVFERTIIEDDSVSYWYVSYETFNGRGGFEGVKINRSFFDPTEIRKEIKIENNVESDDVVHILFVQQMTEAAYQKYLIVEPYGGE